MLLQRILLVSKSHTLEKYVYIYIYITVRTGQRCFADGDIVPEQGVSALEAAKVKCKINF